MLRQTRRTRSAFRSHATESQRICALPPRGPCASATHPLSRVLGYPTVFIAQMFPRESSLPCPDYVLASILSAPHIASLFSLRAGLTRFRRAANPPALRQRRRCRDLSRGPQRKRGDLFIADDDVDIHYGDERLHADHIEYNEKTSESFARGHVHFDYDNEHLEAEEAHYNVSTGHGTFTNVRGTVKIERRANPLILISQNPLYFEAPQVERFLATFTSSATAGSPFATLSIPRGSSTLRTPAFALIKASLSSMPISGSSVCPSSGCLTPLPPPERKSARSGILLPVIGQSNS